MFGQDTMLLVIGTCSESDKCASCCAADPQDIVEMTSQDPLYCMSTQGLVALSIVAVFSVLMGQMIGKFLAKIIEKCYGGRCQMEQGIQVQDSGATIEGTSAVASKDKVQEAPNAFKGKLAKELVWDPLALADAGRDFKDWSTMFASETKNLGGDKLAQNILQAAEDSLKPNANMVTSSDVQIQKAEDN